MNQRAVESDTLKTSERAGGRAITLIEQLSTGRLNDLGPQQVGAVRSLQVSLRSRSDYVCAILRYRLQLPAAPANLIVSLLTLTFASMDLCVVFRSQKRVGSII